MKKLILMPAPKKIEYKEKEYIVPKHGKIIINSKDVFSCADRLKKEVYSLLSINMPILIADDYEDTAFKFTKTQGIAKEGYRLTIDDKGAEIEYTDEAGAFYAVSTIKQIIKQSANVLPQVMIDDSPDFPNRGYMLDISRLKVPKMETIYKIVDFIADLKINQFQLYIEGFSFAYQSFTHVWENLTPITGEDIINLDKYCKDRYIDLVPNQNNFGHMSDWLALEEYKQLAECPDGFQFDGCFLPEPRCLNPLDPKSLEHVKNMSADLLPYFSSNYFNVSCDETLELGQGKSKALAEDIGVGRVYLNFLLKIYDVVVSHGKKMMFWGDIIKGCPELIQELPKDIIALEWGYLAEQPSEESCKKFSDANVPFYVCPGTGSWNTLLGKTYQMRENIKRAAKNGKKYGAIGLLNTDWGDEGHWQPLPVSYAGIAYGAAMSWAVEENENVDLAEFLDVHVFEDTNKLMGNFALTIGDYHLIEAKRPNNITHLVQILYVGLGHEGLVEGLCEADFEKVIVFLNEQKSILEKTNMTCKDANLVLREYENSIRLAKHGLYMSIYALGKRDKDFIKFLYRDIKIIIEEFRKVWLERNTIGNLELSLNRLLTLKENYKKELQKG